MEVKTWVEGNVMTKQQSDLLAGTLEMDAMSALRDLDAHSDMTSGGLNQLALAGGASPLSRGSIYSLG